jgi:hypothetical protein
MRILVNGKPIQVYHDLRSGTDWVEARDGTRYELEIKNESYNRILAVVSVDGINIISGKHERPEESPGYVLNSYMNEKIPGWKVSQEKVREFYFTRPENSYSKKLGADQHNIGVIAAAIFREKPQYRITYNYNTVNDPIWEPYQKWNTVTNATPPVTYDVNSTCWGGSTSCSTSHFGTTLHKRSVQAEYLCSADFAPQQLGTGSGDKMQFETVGVCFGERILETVLTLYYDSKKGLQRRGIWTDDRNALPQAFPSGPYCPDL